MLIQQPLAIPEQRVNNSQNVIHRIENVSPQIFHSQPIYNHVPGFVQKNNGLSQPLPSFYPSSNQDVRFMNNRDFLPNSCGYQHTTSTILQDETQQRQINTMQNKCYQHHKNTSINNEFENKKNFNPNLFKSSSYSHPQKSQPFVGQVSEHCTCNCKCPVHIYGGGQNVKMDDTTKDNKKNSNGDEKEWETDEHKINQRKKQIMFGKKTPEYQKYVMIFYVMYYKYFFCCLIVT
jgi:hypothetical protein